MDQNELLEADEEARKALGISRANWPEHKQRLVLRAAYDLPHVSERDHEGFRRALWMIAAGGHPDDADLAAYLRVVAKPGQEVDEKGDPCGVGAVIPSGMLKYLCDRLDGTLSTGGRPPLTTPERQQIVKTVDDLHAHFKELSSPRPRPDWPTPVLQEMAERYGMLGPRWSPTRRTPDGQYLLDAPVQQAKEFVAAMRGLSVDRIDKIRKEWRKANREAAAEIEATRAKTRRMSERAQALQDEGHTVGEAVRIAWSESRNKRVENPG